MDDKIYIEKMIENCQSEFKEQNAQSENVFAQVKDL